MKRWIWFLIGFAAVAVLGGSILLGCLPVSQASGVTPGTSAVPTASPSPSDVPGVTPTAAMGQVSLVWHRESGADCAGLQVNDLSQVYRAPCEGDPIPAQFTEQELVTYLGHVARYAPFTWRQEPTAANGMVTMHVEFAGRGTREASDAEKQEIATWAATVYARLAAEAEQGALVSTARAMLAARLGIAPEVITTVSVDPVTWPDACLGIPEVGRACAQVETPGYRIVLRVGTDTYTFHSDLKGTTVRLGISQRTPTAPVTTAAPTATATAVPTARPTSTAVPQPTASPTQTPVPTATPTPTPVPTWTPVPAPTDYWRAEYYTNERLLGNPAVVAHEDSPNHTWGYSGPPGVPADYFSARWRRRVYFEEGKYDFRLEADDGVRLWVGGMLVIDRWSGGLRVDTVSQKGLPAGELEVVLEYFELEGYAKVDLGWSKVYIPPTPAPEPVITDWRGEYYNNSGLEGLPSLITNEPTLNFDWGEGSPYPVIHRDRFSARYTRRLAFPAADYRLIVTVDDGVRIWVDGRLLLDAWQAGIRRTYTVDVRLGGVHDLRVEYLEEGGAAALSFSWQVLNAAPGPTLPPPTAPPTSVPPTAIPTPTPTALPASVWLAEYYANAELQGSPVVTRTESNLAFEWAEGSPAGGVPADRFSARFTRRMTLAPGTYRIGLVADDGGRVYVDGRQIIDEWYSGPRRYAIVDVPLGGEHLIRVEYFEQSGSAALYFGLEPRDNAGPSPTPTAISPTPSPGDYWAAEYWNNPDLAGQPTLEREEAGLAFDWQEGSPDRTIHEDTFSARFTRTLTLPRGTYRLHLVVDDGARVYVDDQMVIDEWVTGIRRHVIYDMALEGEHTFCVEYYENRGGAALFFAWEGLSGAAGRLGIASDTLEDTLEAAPQGEQNTPRGWRGR